MKKKCCNINEVIQEFYDYLKAYTINKVKSKDLAEDIVQEVMLKLVEAHQKSPEITNIKAWLFQVSRNTIYDHFKKNNINVSIENDWDLDGETIDANSTLVVSDYIIPMITLLPEKYAVPLKMSDIDNISQKEISNKLGLGISAVKMRIQRARGKLHELFIECCDIEYDKNGVFVSCTIKPACEPLHHISDNLKKHR